jgi:hypothetical protein
MPMEHFEQGEIVLYKEEQWVQYIEDTQEGIGLYDGLKYFYADDDEIEKARLPLALDGLGFKHLANDKKGTEKYRYRNFTIDVTGDRFYIDGREVNYVIEVQGAFGLHKLIPFNLLERRILKSQRSKLNSAAS